MVGAGFAFCLESVSWDTDMVVVCVTAVAMVCAYGLLSLPRAGAGLIGGCE